MPAEITQRLGFDASSAIEQLRKLQASLNSFKQGLQASSNMLGRFPSKATPAIKAMRQLTTDAIKASAALKALSQSGVGQNKLAQEAQGAGKAVNKMGTDTTAVAGKVRQKVAGAFNKASQYVRTLGVSMQSTAQVTQREGAKVVATSRKVAQATTGVGTAAQETAQTFTISWQTVARIIAAQVVIRGISAVASAFKDAQQQAVEFSLAIGEIATISGQALGGLNEISDAVLELSLRTGLATADVAEGLYQTLSNQVVEAGDAIRFEEQAAKLAIVTHSDLKDAVNALSSVMNSYNLDISEVERVSAVLFKTIELGRLRLSEFGNVLGRVAPLTQALGVSYQEMAAAIAALTQKGVPAHTAITQLTQVSQKLLRPTEKLQALYHKWGVETGPEAIARFGGLTGVLLKMKDETAGNSKEFADLLGRVRAMVGALNLTTAEANSLTEAMGQMAEPIGAFNKALEKMEETAGRRAVRAWDNLEVSMVKAGREIIKVTTPLIEFAGLLARNLDKVVIGATAAGTAALWMAGKFSFASFAAGGLIVSTKALMVSLMSLWPIAVAVAAALATMYAVDWIKDSLDNSTELAAQLEKDQEALTKTHEEAASARIKATEKEYSERARLSADFLSNEQKILSRLTTLFEADSKAIGGALTASLDAIFQQREKMVKAMEGAVLGIDGVIKNSLEIIQKTQDTIGKDAFARSLRNLSPIQQAWAKLERAARKAAEAKEAYARAGGDLGKQEAARELSSIAEKMTREAAADAAKAGGRAGEMQGQKAIAKVAADRIRGEGSFILERKALQTDAHKAELAQFKLQGVALRELLKKAKELRDPTDKSQEKINADLKAYSDLLPELSKRLEGAFDVDLLGSLDIDGAMDKLKLGVADAINTATYDWQSVWQQFKAVVASEVVTVRAAIEIVNDDFRAEVRKDFGEDIDFTAGDIGGKYMKTAQRIKSEFEDTNAVVQDTFENIDEAMKGARKAMSTGEFFTWGNAIGDVLTKFKVTFTGIRKEQYLAEVQARGSTQVLTNLQNQKKLLDTVLKAKRGLNKEEVKWFDERTAENQDILDQGKLSNNQVGKSKIVSEKLVSVARDLAAIYGKMEVRPTEKAYEGAVKQLTKGEELVKTWNAEQEKITESAKKSEQQLQETAETTNKLPAAADKTSAALDKTTASARNLKTELQGAETLLNKMGADAELKVPTLPTPETPPALPAIIGREAVAPGTVFPAAEFNQLDDKLEGAGIGAEALKVSVDKVTGAFIEVATASGSVLPPIEGSIYATGQLQQGVYGVGAELDYIALSAGNLKVGVDGATDSTTLAVQATDQWKTGLDSAATSAEHVAAAMTNAATAALQAAQAIAQATAASAGSAYARSGGPTARYFASGGPLSRGNDTQVIMAQAGERIVSARNARRFATELQAINAGSHPVYRDRGGPVTNIGDINVSVSQGETTGQTARDIASALRRELRRGTSRLS